MTLTLLILALCCIPIAFAVGRMVSDTPTLNPETVLPKVCARSLACHCGGHPNGGPS